MSTTEKERAPQTERDARLRELILLIAIRSEGDEPFGAVKLNKLLFKADFSAYVNFGEPITGQEYQALPQGPAPRRMKPILDEMKADGDIAIRTHDYYGKDQQRTFAQRSPDISRFTFAEIELVDRLIKECWGKDATTMSFMSHQFVGWKLAGTGETIPYCVALVDSREPTSEEVKRGLALESLALASLGESAA
ncbi:MAG: Panacea domain-containing protein [Acidobacteriota bacterium]